MKANKCILIINQYASTPETGMGGRHYYLAQELAKLGYQVYIVASAYTHLLRKPKEFNEEFLIEEISKNFNFIWIKLPIYENAHSKKRIINEFLFSWKIRKLKSLLKVKPDVVYHSAPTVLSYYGAKYLADYYHVPYVFEERDIWPLTLVELGGYSVNHPFIKLLQFTQDKAYHNSKFVLSNLPNAVEHLQLRGVNPDKFHWIPNGISLYELENKELLVSEIDEQIPRNKFIVGYLGTIGVANALNYLVDAANLIRKYSDIHFLIVGDGKEKSLLEEKIQKLGLKNISFLKPIPKLQAYSMLSKFDICYIGWHKNSLYRFGISPNKIPEYMLSGKPIVHSFSGNGDLVERADAGIVVDAENASQIAEGILKLYSLDKSQRDEMGNRGLQFAINELDYKILAKKLADVILS